MADPAPPETFDASKAVSLTLGMASPLWLAFAGAAMAGSAFWWMSRWMRPDNLEALFEATAAPPKPVAETPAVLAPVADVVEVAATAVETAAEVAVTETAALAEGLAQVDPVVDAAPAQEALKSSAKAAIDDLTQLVGVGPKLAASLARNGVTSFAQIAAWSADDLVKFDQTLALKGRAVRDAWIDQAQRYSKP